MKPIQDIYPIFEANQVLTDVHLNEIFNYLDKQERLTRTNLIGIGIVCGLEIRLETTGVNVILHLTKGCGVASEGYLVMEPEDVALVSYRQYTLPDDLDYQSFKNKNITPKVQYPLWEMFPAGESDTTLLSAIPDFLNDKAVLLFLELKRESLRNCSPNNCDDKGTQITATVRRLLIKVDDLTKIIAEANELGTGLTFADLETALLARLNLPDLRLPRFDVPNTGSATSSAVLAAFQAVFRTGNLALNTGNALTAAYNAFKPVVEGMYPTDPFASFRVNFGFLDTALQTTTQVRFLQYYYDFFDDLLKAYDEFRWKGVELMCACCPPEGLFPRHLMLGVLFPASVTTPDVYRHHFLASSAIGGCEERHKELKLLFQRLVEMIVHFTNSPPLPQPSPASNLDIQVRLTPSKSGDVPLSAKAIPYYYLQNGTPPLYHIWNAEKSRRNRANQNLSYRSDEYTPTAPVFVTDALRYDLEPHNFLRIEGHLGKNYRSVLSTLLSLKARYRLPIEIIALRSGAFDEKISIDLSKEECRFQDLEALYDALREEVLSPLCEGVMYLYDIPIESGGAGLDGGIPQLSLLKKYAPNFLYKKDTVGAWYEKYLALFQSRPYVDVDQNKIDSNAVLTVYCMLFTGTSGLPEKNFAHAVSIYYFTKLAEILPSSLNALAYADFENKYQDLMGLIRYFRSDEKNKVSDDFRQFIPQEDLIDHFDQVLFSCKLEPLRETHEEYVRRVRQIKQQQFLSFFLQKNPGIQHKAGVPLGGTFIIVYHDDPELVVNPDPAFISGNQSFFADTVIPNVNVARLANNQINKIAVSDAFTRINANRTLASNPDIRLILGSLTGQVPDLRAEPPVAGSSEANRIIDKAVDELIDGTVIADFFLPYLCCSDCSPIQYVLPAPPLGLAVQIGCTDENGTAEITVTPQGGTAPFTYQLDTQPFQELKGNLVLATGTHTLAIRDSLGAESTQKSLVVPAGLTIGTENYIDNVAAQTYQVSFNISGGTPPYQAGSGTVTDNAFTSVPVRSDETTLVVITDSANCQASKEFRHTVQACNLPCDGQSRRCAYRLWIQPPVEGASYKSYSQKDQISFRFNRENITVDGFSLLQIEIEELNRNFQNGMGGAIKRLNSAINQALLEKFGRELGNNRLVITYEPAPTDPFGIFWIEHFVCETFNLEFNFSFSKSSGVEFSRTMRYTNESAVTGASFNGVIFINRLGEENQETRVPAFDCSERNQCSGSDYKKLCEGPDPKPEFTIESLGNNRFLFKGKVGNTPAGEIAAWVWDVFIAQPTEPFYEGDPVDARLEKPGGPVRLTVITQKGCFGFAQEFIKQ